MHPFMPWSFTSGMTKILTAVPGGAQGGGSPINQDEKMAWWREARFGLFIHWGVYAVPAGRYQGKTVENRNAEWLMCFAKAPVSEYKKFAKAFNPVKYDPEAWVALAKAAGMKYIVITSKHHDGFALWDTKVSDWSITRATPYGRDLLMPLVDAARKAGLRIGFYYSQAQDWVHPGGAKFYDTEGTGWDEAHKGDFDAYLRDIAVPQVRELLETYPIDIIWWDTPRWMNNERGAPLQALLDQYPQIITNDRLGGDFVGDTSTPEQYVPATGIKDRDWEVCMTMNDAWGFKLDDHNWKSTRTLIRMLCDTVSKGGNFLLNVGPTAEGEIPPESVERLQAMGEWMAINQEAIYGTTASPFPNLSWGCCSRKVERASAGAKTTLYLFVFDWPADGMLSVPGLTNRVLSARLLDGGKDLQTEQAADATRIHVPATASHADASVIVLQVEGEVETQPFILAQDADGVIALRPDASEVRGRLRVHGALEPRFDHWVDPRDYAAWTVQVDREGTYEFTLDTIASQPVSLAFVTENQRLEKALPAAQENRKFETHRFGTVTLKQGRQTFRLEPLPEGWAPLQARNPRLSPV